MNTPPSRERELETYYNLFNIIETNTRERGKGMEYNEFKEVKRRKNTKRRIPNPRFLSMKIRVNEEEYQTIINTAIAQKKSISAFLRDSALLSIKK